MKDVLIPKSLRDRTYSKRKIARLSRIWNNALEDEEMKKDNEEEKMIHATIKHYSDEVIKTPIKKNGAEIVEPVPPAPGNRPFWGLDPHLQMFLHMMRFPGTLVEETKAAHLQENPQPHPISQLGFSTEEFAAHLL